MEVFLVEKNQQIIQVEDKVPLSLLLPLSIQHIFAMFGASVLVPSVFGINPAIVLFMNGVGTLLFILITKRKSPAYLGSSFAFLATGCAIIASHGYSYALGGFIAVGICECVLSFIIWKVGVEWINIALPAAAMGPVVALIGLQLAASAAETAQILPGDSPVDPKNVIVFLITIGTVIFGNVLFRKFFKALSVFISIIVGYTAACFCGMVDFSVVRDASWFSLPNFSLPSFDLSCILMMLPVLLVITSEHVGHQLVTGKVVDRDLLQDPGLHRSFFACGLSTVLSGLIGSVPTTTYGENIGVMAITKVYSVRVIGGAAAFSILFSFVGKFSALISSIPGPVIGGISFLLYGMIGSSGIRILIDSKVDYNKTQNIILTSVIMVVGLSGVSLNLGVVQLTGMSLACVVGMVMSLLFHLFNKLGWNNESS